MAKSKSRFGLQLRTRLVLILATGILMFVNFHLRRGVLESEPMLQPEPGMVVHLWETPSIRGWPVDFYKAFKSGYSAWSTEGVLIDLAVALAIIGVAVVTCEWVLRRKGSGR